MAQNVVSRGRGAGRNELNALSRSHPQQGAKPGSGRKEPSSKLAAIGLNSQTNTARKAPLLSSGSRVHCDASSAALLRHGGMAVMQANSLHDTQPSAPIGLHYSEGDLPELHSRASATSTGLVLASSRKHRPRPLLVRRQAVFHLTRFGSQAAVSLQQATSSSSGRRPVPRLQVRLSQDQLLPEPSHSIQRHVSSARDFIELLRKKVSPTTLERTRRVMHDILQLQFATQRCFARKLARSLGKLSVQDRSALQEVASLEAPRDGSSPDLRHWLAFARALAGCMEPTNNSRMFFVPEASQAYEFVLANSRFSLYPFRVTTDVEFRTLMGEQLELMEQEQTRMTLQGVLRLDCSSFDSFVPALASYLNRLSAQAKSCLSEVACLPVESEAYRADPHLWVAFARNLISCMHQVNKTDLRQVIEASEVFEFAHENVNYKI